MTCIVAVKTKEGVLLAGDTMGSDGFRGQSFQAPKVFKVSRQVAVGVCGSFRAMQLLEHHLQVPAVDDDERAWAIATLVPAIRDVFWNHGYTKIEHNEETTNSPFILAVRGRIFEVQVDFSVLEPRFPFYAVGSGEYHATGALHALYKPDTDYSNRSAHKLLQAALDTACTFVTSCNSPYNFVATTT